jgi:hypothetical protein
MVLSQLHRLAAPQQQDAGVTRVGCQQLAAALRVSGSSRDVGRTIAAERGERRPAEGAQTAALPSNRPDGCAAALQ